ncbi:MAG: hypothetical protein PHU25_22350, partial [Deltaproteobacteria bacterium]|nr:hypothetical protein [Deltaproteobacteria bacterium]
MSNDPKMPPPPIVPKRPDTKRIPRPDADQTGVQRVPGRTMTGFAPPVPPPPPPVAPKPVVMPERLRVERGGMIGAILVENNLLTDEQRQQCLAAQARSDGSMHFGEIAVRLGFITKEILAIVLDAQKKYVHQVREEQSRMIPL